MNRVRTIWMVWARSVSLVMTMASSTVFVEGIQAEISRQVHIGPLLLVVPHI